MEEVKALSTGYYWDEEAGLKSTKDDRMTEILGDWGEEEWGNDDNDKKSRASSVSLLEPFKIVT